LQIVDRRRSANALRALIRHTATLALLWAVQGTVFAQSAVTPDCSAELAKKGLQAPVPFSPQVSVLSPSLSEEGKRKLASALCLSLYGAKKEVQLMGTDEPWLHNLPVEVADKVNGFVLNAFFARTLGGEVGGGEVPRVLRITSRVVEEYSQEELLWVMGHELGHGVLGHTFRKKSVRWVSSAGSFGAGITALMGKTLPNRVRLALGVISAAGAYVSACGPAFLGSFFESSSDEFGVRVAQNAGLSLADAKQAALSLFERYPQEQGRCLDGNSKDHIFNDGGHPSTKDRAEAVRNLR